MRMISAIAAAIAMLGAQAAPALAGGVSRIQVHGAPKQQPRALQGGQAHTRYGGPRLEQRPDPNHQNPYRPMFSLDATNPGEPHPCFRTRKDGFGYPGLQPSVVYLGNGVYVIPR